MSSTSPDLASAFGLSNLLRRGDGSAPPRTPMIFTCSMWKANSIPPIALRVNPHVVQFNQPKRITKRNTQGGTVFFHWSDLNGLNNDILELAFKGRTGNIRTKQSIPGSGNPSATGLQDAGNVLSGGVTSTPGTPNQGAAKLLLWSRLYTLTRVPVVDPSTKLRNVFEITYRSPLLPRAFVFYGFFSKVLDFSETAEQPWLVEWAMNFTVQATQPSLDVITAYLTSLLSQANAGNYTTQTQVAAEQQQESNTSGAILNSKFNQG